MDHPTIDQLSRWRRGDVAEDEVLSIAEHLETCEVCRLDATEQLGLEVAADAICEDIESEPRPRRVWPWLIAAALAIGIVAPLIRNRTPPAVVATAGDRWTALEDRVRRGATIDEPQALRDVRTESDVLRGGAESKRTFEPSGVIVRSARPLFRWPAPSGAISEVEIFRGDSEVVRSGALALSQWTPPHDLERGVTYTWTVRVEHGGTVEILPASPSPVARFRVLDAATLADIDAASQRHPNDHLLFGILYARAGLRAEAEAELGRLTNSNDTAVAQRLMQEMDSWSR